MKLSSPLSSAVAYLLLVLNTFLSGFLHLPVTLTARDLSHFLAAAVGGLAVVVLLGVPLTPVTILAALPGVLAVAYRQIRPNPAEATLATAVTLPPVVTPPVVTSLPTV